MKSRTWVARAASRTCSGVPPGVPYCMLALIDVGPQKYHLTITVGVRLRNTQYKNDQLQSTIMIKVSDTTKSYDIVVLKLGFNGNIMLHHRTLHALSSIQCIVCSFSGMYPYILVEKGIL